MTRREIIELPISDNAMFKVVTALIYVFVFMHFCFSVC
jgi:hypothetical protein